jgi:hypothetical protein
MRNRRTRTGRPESANSTTWKPSRDEQRRNDVAEEEGWYIEGACAMLHRAHRREFRERVKKFNELTDTKKILKEYEHRRTF